MLCISYYQWRRHFPPVKQSSLWEYHPSKHTYWSFPGCFPYYAPPQAPSCSARKKTRIRQLIKASARSWYLSARKESGVTPSGWYRTAAVLDAYLRRGQPLRRGLFRKVLDLWGLKSKSQAPSAEDRKEVPWTPSKTAFELGEVWWMASGEHGLQKLAGFQHGTKKTLCPKRKILSVEITDTNRFGGKSLLSGLVDFCCSGRSGDVRRRMEFVEERVLSWQWQKRNRLFWEKFDKLNSRWRMYSSNTSGVVSVS